MADKTKEISKDSDCDYVHDFKYQELVVNDSKYLIGVCKTQDKRQIILTNLQEFYEEVLLKQDIIERCEHLNPILIDIDYEEIIDNLFLDIVKYVTACSLEKISLESKIDDGRFQFHINLHKIDSKKFYENHANRFFPCFFELNHRYNCLLDTIRKKDQEIAEYKAQGLQLLRKSLITEHFSENLFETKLKNKCSMDKFKVFLDTHHFYNSIKHLNVDEEKTADIKSEVNKNIDNSKATSNSKSNRKRPSSSDIRCAIPAKLEKKTKIVKVSSVSKFL